MQKSVFQKQKIVGIKNLSNDVVHKNNFNEEILLLQGWSNNLMDLNLITKNTIKEINQKD